MDNKIVEGIYTSDAYSYDLQYNLRDFFDFYTLNILRNNIKYHLKKLNLKDGNYSNESLHLTVKSKQTKINNDTNDFTTTYNFTPDHNDTEPNTIPLHILDFLKLVEKLFKLTKCADILFFTDKHTSLIFNITRKNLLIQISSRIYI